MKKAAAAPLDARPQILIDGCQVCGDWTPDPALEHAAAGTAARRASRSSRRWPAATRGASRTRSSGSSAHSTPPAAPRRARRGASSARSARTRSARLPGRPVLGGPVLRARSDRARGGARRRDRRHRLELPLPPCRSPAAWRPVLADVDAVTRRSARSQITVLGDKVFVGRMPRAHMGGGALAVDLGKDGYPGTETEVAKLPVR